MPGTGGPIDATLLLAPRILADPRRWIEGGGILVRRGRVEALAATPAAARRLARRAGVRRIELAADCVTPGLVNAHAHLELSALAGRLPRDAGFAGWIGALVRERSRLSARTLASAAGRAARALLSGGTTTVGDIASLPLGLTVALDAGLRAVVYREVLDVWRPERTDEALASVARKLPPRARRREGLSPHAPYSTSPALLRAVDALARRRRAPLACHWAESAQELAWLAGERGAFDGLLGRRGPGASGLDLLERGGLLRRETTLVHGNRPGRGEPARIARAGSSLVHCPGTHRFFERPAFPWRRYRAAGVPLALGTDSLASNETLDMLRELRLARETLTGLSPEEAFEMATLGGARALGLEGQVGALAVGQAADLVTWSLAAASARTALEALTSGEARATGVWVAGRPRRFESPGSLP